VLKNAFRTVACSQDGTALLWDVPTQKSIGSYGSAEHPANSCWLHAGQRPAGCQSTGFFFFDGAVDGNRDLIYLKKNREKNQITAIFWWLMKEACMDGMFAQNRSCFR